MSAEGGLGPGASSPRRDLVLPQLQRRRDVLGVSALKRSISDALESRRLLVLVPFFLLAGIAAYAGLVDEPDPAVWLVVGVACLTSGLATAMGFGWMRRPRALLAAFGIGLCLLPAHAYVAGTPMLGFPIYGAYEATVDRVVSRAPDATRLVITNIVPVADAPDPDLRKARILVRGDAPVSVGDRISASLRLAPVPGPVLPASFDNQFHAYFER